MSDNKLFAEIVPSEEASLSGGHYRRRRRGRAEAFGDATASGNQVFTETITNAEVDPFGNSSASSSSTSIAVG